MKDQIIRLLKWSERYTRTDMLYLAKGGFWLIFGQATVFLLSLLLVWAFANLVTPEVYGQYRFLTAVIALLGLTALPGINIALIRSVARGHSGEIQRVLPILIKWSLLGVGAGLVGSAYYFLQGNLELALFFGIIAVATPFIAPFTLYTPYLNGLKEFKLQAIAHITQRFVVVAAVLTALLFTQNIIFLILTYIISTIVVQISVYIHTIYQRPPKQSYDPELIPHAKELSIVTGLRTGASHLDKLVLWYLVGPAQIAVYVVALAIPNELQSALGKIGMLALPKMASRDTAELRDGLLRKLFIFFLGMLPVFGLYVLTIPIAFNYLFPQYTDAIPLAQLAGLLILASPIILLTQYFNATRQTKPLYIIHLTEPAVFVLGLLIFVPLYGALGAVLAILGKFVVAVLLHFYFFLTHKPATH